MKEIHRILAPAGRAEFVVGNSRLRGVDIDNAGLIERVAWRVGFKMASRFDRPIPAQHRYLPPPRETGGTLDARMRSNAGQLKVKTMTAAFESGRDGREHDAFVEGLGDEPLPHPEGPARSTPRSATPCTSRLRRLLGCQPQRVRIIVAGLVRVEV